MALKRSRENVRVAASKKVRARVFHVAHLRDSIFLAMQTYEEALREKIRSLSTEITTLEDELSRKALREKLNALREERNRALEALGQIQSANERERMQKTNA
jgi:hypothetical protein